MKPEQKHKGHPHAELMKLYAEDAMESETPWENWECNDPAYDKEWAALRVNPLWSNHLKYRRKPRFIEINGHQVPEPEREGPQNGSFYYYPFPAASKLYGSTLWVEDNKDDLFRLSNGLVHLTREAAISHSKALLSFTKKEVIHDHQNT